MVNLTVLMPVYNGIPYISEAVESILAQTLSEFIFLIINDGSTDATGDYLRSIKDPRVEVLNQPHKGLGNTLNVGIKKCETEFLARMDADDISLPQRLEKQLNYLQHNHSVGVIGTQLYYFVDKYQIKYGPKLYQKHEDIYSALLSSTHAFCHPSLMFRTAVLKKFGGYRISGIGEDWDLFLRLGENTLMANLDEALHMVRFHSGSVVWKNSIELKIKIDYAIKCSKLRSKGLPEVSFDSFISKHFKNSIRHNIKYRFYSFSDFQYRKAIVDHIKGKKYISLVRTFLAAITYPNRALNRLKREFKTLLSQR